MKEEHFRSKEQHGQMLAGRKIRVYLVWSPVRSECEECAKAV